MNTGKEGVGTRSHVELTLPRSLELYERFLFCFPDLQTLSSGKQPTTGTRYEAKNTLLPRTAWGLSWRHGHSLRSRQTVLIGPPQQTSKVKGCSLPPSASLYLGHLSPWLTWTAGWLGSSPMADAHAMGTQTRTVTPALCTYWRSPLNWSSW